MRTVQSCRDAGVELWLADFELTPDRIILTGYYQLDEWQRIRDKRTIIKPAKHLSDKHFLLFRRFLLFCQ